MKIILACEGSCEVQLINSLLEKKQLIFSCDILLDEPLNIRQISEIKPIIQALPIDEEIIVYRIGDTLNDDLNLKGFEMRNIKSFKVCTKTEIEILPIINENLFEKYLKVKRRLRPKEFAKQYIKSFNFYDYIQAHDMLSAISEYKHLKSKGHKKDEYCLFDLITHQIK